MVGSKGEPLLPFHGSIENRLDIEEGEMKPTSALWYIGKRLIIAAALFSALMLIVQQITGTS